MQRSTINRLTSIIEAKVTTSKEMDLLIYDLQCISETLYEKEVRAKYESKIPQLFAKC